MLSIAILGAVLGEQTIDNTIPWRLIGSGYLISGELIPLLFRWGSLAAGVGRAVGAVGAAGAAGAARAAGAAGAAELERSNAIPLDSIYCPTRHLFILFCKEEMRESLISTENEYRAGSSLARPVWSL